MLHWYIYFQAEKKLKLLTFFHLALYLNFMHVKIESVSSDYFLLELDNHTDYMDT